VNDVPEIVSQTLIKDKLVERLLFKDEKTGQRIPYENEMPFYKNQSRIVFGNNLLIDPRKISDYLAIRGYSALAKVLTMEPEEIIEEIRRASL